MAEVEEMPVRVRTLFLSDLHLGTRGCQAGLLLTFLRDYDADTIYLVGDIVDGWQLRSGWYARARRSSTCRAITTNSCATMSA